MVLGLSYYPHLALDSWFIPRMAYKGVQMSDHLLSPGESMWILDENPKCCKTKYTEISIVLLSV